MLLALSGELRSAPDKVRVNGHAAGDYGPDWSGARAGLVAAPEDRYGHAAAPDMSLVENALLTGALRRGLTRHGFIDWRRDPRLRRGDHRQL